LTSRLKHPDFASSFKPNRFTWLHLGILAATAFLADITAHDSGQHLLPDASMNASSLLVTSDLNLSASSEGLIVSLAQKMASHSPSAVVIAGNLGESVGDLRTVLTLFKKHLACPLAFVPGNQDLFFQENLSSHELWTHGLRQEVETLGVKYLQGSTLELQGAVVTGTIGWYDYSTALAEMQRTQEYWIQCKLENNVPDALRIDWEWSDPEFATLVSRSLEATLDSLEADPLTREVVVVSHFPVFEWQLPTLISGRQGEDFQRILRAYQGNLNLGQEILQRSKVTGVVSAHVGIQGHKAIHRANGGPVNSYLTGSTPTHPSFVEIPLGR
jgi:hypothetical protein